MRIPKKKTKIYRLFVVNNETTSIVATNRLDSRKWKWKKKTAKWRNWNERMKDKQNKRYSGVAATVWYVTLQI